MGNSNESVKTLDFICTDTHETFTVGYCTGHLIQEVVGKWRAGENPPLKPDFVSLFHQFLSPDDCCCLQTGIREGGKERQRCCKVVCQILSSHVIVADRRSISAGKGKSRWISLERKRPLEEFKITQEKVIQEGKNRMQINTTNTLPPKKKHHKLAGIHFRNSLCIWVTWSHAEIQIKGEHNRWQGCSDTTSLSIVDSKT